MQINDISAEGLKHAFKVTVAAQDIEKRLNARLAEVARDIRLPGFRPGKVPTAVIKQRYGASLMGEVLEQTVNESSNSVLSERNLRPALQPKVEIESFNDGADLVFAMTVEVLPEIQPVAPESIELERLKPEIPDSEVDASLQKLAERFRGSEDAPEGTAAEIGDTTVIDAIGMIDGEAFPGGKVDAFELELGSGKFIPGFEGQLVGAKAGDHVTVNVKFPDDYAADQLRGKDAVFEVDVKALKRKLPATIDGDLAEQLGMEDLEALRQAVRDQIERDYVGLARQKLKRDLLDILSERYVFEVPAGMVDVEFDGIWKQYEEEKARAKAAVPAPAEGEAAAEPEESEEEAKAEYRKIAERRVRLGLLLAEFGRLHEVQVTQEELNRAVMGEARRYPGQEKAVFDYYKKNPEAMASLRAPIYEEKVVDLLVEKANVTDKPVSPEELVKLAGAEDEEEAAA
jgi:trigger factor